MLRLTVNRAEEGAKKKSWNFGKKPLDGLGIRGIFMRVKSKRDNETAKVSKSRKIKNKNKKALDDAEKSDKMLSVNDI
jgi:hypothetical protein